MPKVDVYDVEGKKVKTLDLKEEVFGLTPNEAVVHSVLVNYLANQRQVHKVPKQEQKFLVVVENHGDKKVQVEQDTEVFVHALGRWRNRIRTKTTFLQLYCK